MMPDLKRIASAMGGEVRGDYAVFPTPGHSKKDRGSWAQLNPDAPDGVLIHSANGGDPLEIKDRLRKAGELPTRSALCRARDVAAWEYQNADGVTVYRKVRMSLPDGGKSYRFEHPDGKGGWLPKRGDAPPVPYRLCDLITAPAGAMVVMAEGEKQADKLASWGFVATSLRDWSPRFSTYVTGRTVAILPDNDPPGADYAEKASSLVAAAGGMPVTIHLPGLPHGGDVMDWGGDAAQLQDLIDAALKAPQADPDEPFPIADLSLLSRFSPTPKAFLWPGFIPANEVTLATGIGGSNKSTLGLQLCVCMAAGRPMLGVEVAEGPSLYLTAEDDEEQNHWRLTKIAAANGTSLDELHGKLAMVSVRGLLNNELATFDHQGRISVTPAYRRLRATIAQTGAKLIVLDNVAHLFAGNENDRAQVTAFINLLYQLCRDYGATVLLIGHPNKSGTDYSGSTAWLNAVRSHIVLETPQPDVDPDARTVRVGKANYARLGSEIGFRWHDFALVADAELPTSIREELAETARATADNAVFLACLAERNRQERPVSDNKAARTFAPKEFAMMPEAKGLSVARLEAAMDRLFRINAIERGVVCRVGRKDREGLIECADPRADLAPTGCADVRSAVAPTCADVRSHTPPKGGYGRGPSEAAAPEPLKLRDGLGFPDEPDDPAKDYFS